jgi:inhibitor of cysteine peptidase
MRTLIAAVIAAAAAAGAAAGAVAVVVHVSSQPARAAQPASAPAGADANAQAGAGKEKAAMEPIDLGESDDGKSVNVDVGRRVRIRLAGNPTTGYSWFLTPIEGQAVKADGELEYKPNAHRPGMVGVGGTFELVLRAAKAGESAVRLEYKRPWEKDTPPLRKFAVTLAVRNASTTAPASALATTMPASGKEGPPKAAAVLPYEIYEAPYFVKNTFEPNAPQSFAVIRTMEQFNAVFGVGMVMGGPRPQIKAETFESRIVVVTVKRGPMCSYKVESVTAKGAGLQVRYEAKVEPPGSATFAVPLILAVPKGNSASVTFVENGKEVKAF